MTMNQKDLLPEALRAAYLALHRHSDACFSKHGVTADQFVMLATLTRGTALTQRELARRMASDASTVRAMLVLLERQGLVRRETHPTDSRARTVELTFIGKRKFNQVWKAGERIRAQIFNSMQPHESEILVRLLNKISETLNAKPPARIRLGHQQSLANKA